MITAKTSDTFSSNGHINVRKSVRVNSEETNTKSSEEIQKLTAELNELKLKNEELTGQVTKYKHKSEKAKKLKKEIAHTDSRLRPD
jgi:peptidoglycan hydrolase CwlO-like protein